MSNILRVVIEQSMFFPWCGYLELAKYADIFVHYDDVQLPRGASFTTRVQVKTSNGQLWISALIDKSIGHLPKNFLSKQCSCSVAKCVCN